MKSMDTFLKLFLIVILTGLIACGKETDYSQYEVKLIGGPDGPVPLGCIRGYFGKYYRVFTQSMEHIQPVDSFSNIYFYGNCNGRTSQINLLRSDSAYAAAIYIIGYSPDSLPQSQPVPEEFGRFTDLQFYKLWDWSGDSTDGYKPYQLASFYGKNVFITENKDDVLTGTFEGFLNSPVYGVLHVTQGEFKIRIYRKDLSCNDILKK